jgi:hypothetical protein
MVELLNDLPKIIKALAWAFGAAVSIAFILSCVIAALAGWAMNMEERDDSARRDQL